MGTRKNNLWAYAVLALGALGACGDDGDPAPSGPSLTLDGGLGTGLLDAGGGNADGGRDAGAQVPSGDCRGANGCFSCTPTTSVQLLNACASGCQPFDNAKRLPGYQAGKLPPL